MPPCLPSSSPPLQGGKLTDLTYLVLGDRLLGWAGIQASAKASVMYDGRVSAVPFIPAPQVRPQGRRQGSRQGGMWDPLGFCAALLASPLFHFTRFHIHTG